MEKNSIQQLGQVTARSTLKYTKKNWDQWIEILDAAGARNWTHKETVAYLKKKYKLSLWWQQGVTMGYQIAIGQRIQGRNLKGEYSLVASKTIPMSNKAMWKFLNSPEGLQIWLKPQEKFQLKLGEVFESNEGTFGEVRTVKKGSKARIHWQDTDWETHSVVQLIVNPRKGDKCLLIFQQEKIKDGREKIRLKAYWQKILEEIFAFAKEQ